MEFRHACRGEVGEIPRDRIVYTDPQRKDPPRSPDRLGGGFQIVGGDCGKCLFDIAQRILEHIRIKPAEITRLADILQPSRTVGEVGSTAPYGIAERGAEILIAFKSHLTRHPHHGVGFNVCRLRNLAHG